MKKEYYRDEQRSGYLVFNVLVTDLQLAAYPWIFDAVKASDSLEDFIREIERRSTSWTWPKCKCDAWAEAMDQSLRAHHTAAVYGLDISTETDRLSDAEFCPWCGRRLEVVPVASSGLTVECTPDTYEFGRLVSTAKKAAAG